MIQKPRCVVCRLPVWTVMALGLLCGQTVAQVPFVTGGIAQPIGGVRIDADGLLREVQSLSDADRAAALASAVLTPPMGGDLAKPSPLRKVSLRRLEDAVGKVVAAKQALPAEMRLTAGLVAVRYVWFDSDTRDVVIAGPAEPWSMTPTGEVVGTESGRPLLHLEDLLTVLRYEFPPDDVLQDAFLGCSIDPTPAGVQRFNAFLQQLGGRFDRTRLPQIFAAMEQAMGPQSVRVFGVAPSSRTATVMVAADYRLKRIALGHDPSPVPEVKSYMDLAARKFRGGPQPQHRWWFVADYEAVWETPDKRGYELDGQGLRVATAQTVPGQTEAEPQLAASPAAEAFAESFTEHFPKLIKKQPVFAELQNLVALAAVAALVAEKDDGHHWRPELFVDAHRLPLPEYGTPRQTPALVSYRLVRNRDWLISISGGVEVDARKVLTAENRRPALRRPVLNNATQLLAAPDDTPRWWWD